MEVHEFKIWYDGFVAGKSQLGQEDMEILRKKIMELHFNPLSIPVSPWPIYPTYPIYPSYPLYAPYSVSDTASEYSFHYDKQDGIA